MSPSDSKAEARTEPTLPRCPATATLIGPLMSVSARSAAPAAAVAPAAVASPETTLTRWRWRRCQCRGHRLLVDLLLDRLALSGELLDRRLAAQVEPALAVDLCGLDHDLVANVGHLFWPLYPVVGQLRDVDQAVLVRQHLDEQAEGHDPYDLSLVDLADLDLVGQALDPVDRLLAGLLVDRGDEDPSIVLDIDLGAGLFGDLANHLASWADDVADLVGVDLDGGDAWRVGAHLAAGARQHGQHLVEHEEPRHTSLLQCLGQDLVRQALDLDVHLQGGDSVLGAGHLEVHIAQVVFDALDVGEHRGLALTHDEAHRDARDRRLDRDARVHQGQRRPTNGCHRG